MMSDYPRPDHSTLLEIIYMSAVCISVCLYVRLIVRVSGWPAAQLTDFYRNLHFSLYPHDWVE